MEKFTAVALALAFVSMAQLIMAYARYRADQRDWKAAEKARAVREKYLIDQVVALREQLATQKEARVRRAAKDAEWRMMAEEGDRAAADALIDVDLVIEQEAVVDRVRREQLQLLLERLRLQNVHEETPRTKSR